MPSGATVKDCENIQAAKACHVAIAEIASNGHDVDFRPRHSDETWSYKHAEVEAPEVEDVALILHTSGTIGRPKVVRYPKNRFR